MANAQHLEILNQSRKIWNAKREKSELLEADLSGSDLGGMYLSHIDLWGANLEGANLKGVDLSCGKIHNARFRKARLNEAYLYLANASGADFSYADLTGANLEGADLSHARFCVADLSFATIGRSGLSGKRADLTGSRLDGANLNGTNLCGAELSCADLTGAYLRNTQLSGAVFGKTAMVNIDLSRGEGLETAIHHSPSGIATSTLERTAEGVVQDPSRREAVEVFLRRAGVPEDLLTHWFALRIAQLSKFHSCFIVYSYADRTFARRLYDHLQSKGIRCWLDEKQLDEQPFFSGDDIYDNIYEKVKRGIRHWDKTLLCCSKTSLSSWWLDDEIAFAFRKEDELKREHRNKVLTLMPIDLDGYLFSDWKSFIERHIRSRVAADFTGWETDHAKFETASEEVAKALRRVDHGKVR